jgi:predicted nuclease of predicted toxin-antitoxin system
LDEQVKSVIARELRRRGIDVTTTVEAGLRIHSDEVQLAFICQEKRVLFTQDDDFLKMASLTSAHPGKSVLSTRKSFDWTNH